eukprot:13624768-Ditylum_brightwellii.AAC.1
MAPLGAKVLVHIKPNKQATWGYHVLPGWYIGPAMWHYRCYEVMMKSTGAKRITDTVHFHHHNVVMLTVTQADQILKATKDLNEAIRGIQRDAPPDYVDAVDKLRRVLLKEKPSKTTHCACNQPVEKPTTKVVEKETTPPVQSPQSPVKAPTSPEIPYITNDENSDDDESVNGKDNNNYKVDTPSPPRYNLRMCANDSVNSIIFKETPMYNRLQMIWCTKEDTALQQR